MSDCTRLDKASLNTVPTFVPGRSMLPTVALACTVLFWGTSFCAAKVAVAVVGPWSLMWIRMAVAFVLLAPFTNRLIPHGYLPGDWKFLLPLVLLMPCAYFFLESHALTLTTSSQAGVIAASVPLMVAVGARFLFGETLPLRAVVGLLVAVAGVTWLTLAGKPNETAPNPLLGNLMELGAMACSAGYMLLVKGLSDRYGSWTLTALQTLAGLIFFVPGIGVFLNGDWHGWSQTEWLAMLYLGGCVTLGAFGLYNWAMCRLPARAASSWINLVPVVAVFSGWLMLGETLNLAQCMASVCVFVGVWLSQRQS